jgi:hypothetical protein
MNVVTSTWHQLVRRRLWPVAVLLLAALAAIPILLARDPEAAPADPAPVVSTESGDQLAQPVVAQVTAEDRSRRRHVLGARKDPFAPAPVKKKPQAQSAQSPAPASQPKPAGDPAPPASTSPSVSIGGGMPTPVVVPAPPKRYYTPGTIVVRVGDGKSESGERLTVKKLEPLPSDELPLLIYMGLTKDGKKAKFLVDAAVEVDGDGVCKPHPSTCETIELAVGETEFLDVYDPEAEVPEGEEPEPVAQFQLDLVDIKRKGDDDVK